MTWLTFFARQTGRQLTHLRYEIVWHCFPFKRCFCLFQPAYENDIVSAKLGQLASWPAGFKFKKKNNLATVWVGKTIPRESAKGSLHHRGLPMHKRTLNADVTIWKHPGWFNGDSQNFRISCRWFAVWMSRRIKFYSPGKKKSEEKNNKILIGS